MEWLNLTGDKSTAMHMQQEMEVQQKIIVEQ